MVQKPLIGGRCLVRAASVLAGRRLSLREATRDAPRVTCGLGGMRSRRWALCRVRDSMTGIHWREAPAGVCAAVGSPPVDG